MEVYLVPVGPSRYELYCEVAEHSAEEAEGPPRGYLRRLVRRLVHRFRQTIADAERELRHGTPPGVKRGLLARLRARMMRWVAESIAEQRLLWHLRHQDSATLHYPDDVPESEAAATLRQQLGRDFDKHRFWLAIDMLLTLAVWPLSFVPGPNFILYYFLFRIVGHYLSLRGARRGLSRVSWQHRPSEPLAELRRLLELDPRVREPRVHAVAAALRLEHLGSFFERSAVST